MTKRTYSELSKLNSFEERYEYLKLSGAVGEETFGFDRYLNQALYSSKEWKQAKNRVLLRDEGCDLGIKGNKINKKAIIHHMNPITREQIENRDSEIFNPEYLITVSHSTHNAIHYGDKDLLATQKPVERKSGDTVPWR